MKTLKRICFALLLTGLILSCVTKSADAATELYPTADGSGNDGMQGGGDG